MGEVVVDHFVLKILAGVKHSIELVLQILDVGEVDEVDLFELERPGLHFLVLEDEEAALVL